jgi:hypothetical protein
LIIINFSCSVIRKRQNIDYGLLNVSETEKTIKSLEEKNVTENNFFIQKAEIDISTPKGVEKVIGSIKYEKPGKFLISLKSRTGIEAVRMLISSDTILVNDRINKRLYFGSPDYLKSRYGVSNDFLAVILGDFISDSILDLNNLKCLNGKVELIEESGKMKIKYIIDCKLNKVVFASNDSDSIVDKIEVKFDKFRKSDTSLAPERIEINDLSRKTNVVMRIKKVEYLWRGNVEFIPGKNYEQRKLL